MVSVLAYLILFCELTTSSFGVEIIRGPETVSNASIGGIAKFECIINSESDLPWWNIDGYDVDVTNLPPGLQFESNAYSKTLTVNPVLQEMNNTCFYCYLLVHSGRIESSRAKLIIQSPIPSIPESNNEITMLSPTLYYSGRQHVPSYANIHSTSTLQNHSVSGELPSMYERPRSSTYVGTTTPMMSVDFSIQVTPVPSMAKSSPLSYSSHRNLILGVSGSVATVMFTFVIVAIVAWIYRKNRNKDVSDEHNEKCHVYEEVVTANLALHHNPAYENPMRMRLEENPAYVSTHYYSRS